MRILHLEDNDADAELVRMKLAEEGPAPEIVVAPDRAAFVEALERGKFDLILSDFSLPGFDGAGAIALAREKRPEVPFIFVSGTIGEDAAIQALKAGATDYVLKDRLSRLAPVVRRALEEARERAERKRIEAQFLQSQKMEAVGRLAGGIAHDFNNLLTVINGYSMLLLEGLPVDHPMRGKLMEIHAAGERAAALTQQFLAFSRKQVVETRVLDVNAVVLNMDRMLRRMIGEDVELASVPSAEPGLVEADRGQLEQVITNLVVNARDAMPRGGKVTIETTNVDLDAAYARGHAEVRPGPYVMIAVTDTGCGMDEKTQAHLFEPYFTTKPEGKGTGLGLSTVYGIVRKAGGHVWAYSEVGHGTTFRVYLPRVTDGSPAPTPEPASGRGSETILVVEDDEAVRALIREILSKAGYAVLETRHGGEAVTFCERHPGPIHLLLTDVVMPRMSGPELAGVLGKIRPDMKVIFLSGYSGSAMLRAGMVDRTAAFVAKPFTQEVLLKKVREVLERPKEGA